MRWLWAALCVACATSPAPPPQPGEGATADGGVALADAGAVPVPADAVGPAEIDVGGAGACGKAGAETGVLRRTVVVDGKMRSYLLSVPASHQAGVALPLVFAWHGLGGSAMYFRGAHGLEAPANGAAIFVYPDGLPQPGFGNAPGWDLRPEGDVRLFDAMLAEVTATWCVDRQRVFSTGHSFGGYMTNTLGCLRGQVFRAIAPVAGGLPMSTSACGDRALPAWLTHGSNDPVVPFAQGEGARDHWRQQAGCAETSQPVEPAGCVRYDGCQVPVEWCVHQRMHSWPPFASAAIWKFFDGLK